MTSRNQGNENIDSVRQKGFSIFLKKKKKLFCIWLRRLNLLEKNNTKKYPRDEEGVEEEKKKKSMTNVLLS